MWLKFFQNTHKICNTNGCRFVSSSTLQMWNFLEILMNKIFLPHPNLVPREEDPRGLGRGCSHQNPLFSAEPYDKFLVRLNTPLTKTCWVWWDGYIIYLAPPCCALLNVLYFTYVITTIIYYILKCTTTIHFNFRLCGGECPNPLPCMLLIN